MLVSGEQVGDCRPVAELILIPHFDTVIVHRLPTVEPRWQVRPWESDPNVLCIGIIEHRQPLTTSLKGDLVIQFVAGV